jgi:nucleoside-diphosphate-sugar epimerase
VRVLVTGGTGFTGAHTTKVLVDAGYDVVLLVRSAARIDENVKPLGVEHVDHVVGDMTDRDSVATAMDGCDAVVHSAALVAMDSRRAAEVLHANPLGAENVLGLAAERGLDPIVHVSSLSALYDPCAPVLHPGSALATPVGAYSRSKVMSDRVARRLQQDGAPVVITYPGGIIGPAAGALVGESNVSLVTFAKAGTMVFRDGGWSAIDVRDLAAVHAAIVDEAPGPRLYVCGGPNLSWRETAELLRRATGRRFPVLPVPGSMLRAVGRVLDAAPKVVPMQSSMTEESMRFVTQWVPTDDSRVAEELGIEWRDPVETFADTLRSLYELGVLQRKHVGRVAAS